MTAARTYCPQCGHPHQAHAVTAVFIEWGEYSRGSYTVEEHVDVQQCPRCRALFCRELPRDLSAHTPRFAG